VVVAVAVSDVVLLGVSVLVGVFEGVCVLVLVKVLERVLERVSDGVTDSDAVADMVRVLEGVIRETAGGRATPRRIEPCGAAYTTLESKVRESTLTTVFSTHAYTTNAA